MFNTGPASWEVTVQPCRLQCPQGPHTPLNPLLDQLQILKVFEHGFYTFLILCPQILCPQHLIHGLNAALHDLACDGHVFYHKLSLLLELKSCYSTKWIPSVLQHLKMKLQLIHPTQFSFSFISKSLTHHPVRFILSVHDDAACTLSVHCVYSQSKHWLSI